MSPESVWLFLYRCHADVLCEPMKAVELTDTVYAAFMERFTSHTVAPPPERGDDD